MSSEEDFNYDDDENFDHDDGYEEYSSDGEYDTDANYASSVDGKNESMEFKTEEALVPSKVEYRCHTMQGLVESLESRARNVCDVLKLSQEQALTLLQFYSWNSEKLIDEYINDPRDVTSKSGIVIDKDTKKYTVKTYDRESDFTCMICCEDAQESYSLICGHEFCLDCYKRYIEDKVSSGTIITCPSCDVALDLKDLDAIAGQGNSSKLLEYSARMYIDKNPQYKWCPAPDCHWIIEKLDQQQIANIVENHLVPIAICGAGHQFCIQCLVENHTPCPCDVAAKWLAKCRDDSETINWIISNAKACPSCDSMIEKNGGCNHMVCKKCRHEFCWICMGPWAQHGNQYYQCNRYKEDNDTTQNSVSKKRVVSAKKLLKRYLHFHNLFMIHESSMKQDERIVKTVEMKVRELQEASGISWIEAQFLTESANTLLRARGVLKWSYAFAYYCDASLFMDLFETAQAGFSDAVEELSKLFEIEDPQEVVLKKTDFLNKSHYLLDRQKKFSARTVDTVTNGTLNMSNTD